VIVKDQTQEPVWFGLDGLPSHNKSLTLSKMKILENPMAGSSVIKATVLRRILASNRTVFNENSHCRNDLSLKLFILVKKENA
jgi:hypothetical protein